MADLISFIQKQKKNEIFEPITTAEENGRYMKCVSVQQKMQKQKEEIVSSSTGKKGPSAFQSPQSI
jgi:hypothetical protein